MLHLLPKPGSAECDELIGLMQRLSPAAQKMILERGEENGAGYLVTDKIPDFRNLRDWLDKVASAAAPPVAPVLPESVSPEPPPPVPARGEFTSLFQAVPETSAPPDPPPQAPAPPPAQPAAPPGAFTRLFPGSQSP